MKLSFYQWSSCRPLVQRKFLNWVACLLLGSDVFFEGRYLWASPPSSQEPSYKINEKFSLPPPPSQDSPQLKSDISTILSDQKNRSSNDCARARSEVKMGLENFFGPPYGPLTKPECQALQPFFEKLKTVSLSINLEIKSKYNRLRPYEGEAHSTPCLPHEKTKSYPSGHATMSKVFADVLSEIFPERSKALQSRAEEIGHDRILGGVHYPSDVKAGRDLADQIIKALGSNKEYLDDLAKAKKQLSQ